MDIKKSLATQIYAETRIAAPVASSSRTAEEIGSEFLGSFAATLQNGEDVARSAMTGGADPHALVEALASTQMAVETVVTVRDKVVEAYQEILRMPV
ncbi:flagellar hook-basal body complex protein FliE [Thioclava sp. FR2]|uniref:flagellar hook-basal body complex protein FliE n=1 Tax=Thioclava sp. FR2 TaxID=3445780 RepID=UPI003EBA78BE